MENIIYINMLTQVVQSTKPNAARLNPAAQGFGVFGVSVLGLLERWLLEELKSPLSSIAKDRIPSARSADFTVVNRL
jgi:hypothetical protein